MYQTLEFTQQLPSSWRDNLDENPDGQYKFGSVHVQVDLRKKITIRTVYGVLDLIGDIGGLTDGLYYIISLLLSQFWRFNSARFMLTYLFRENPVRKAK